MVEKKQISRHKFSILCIMNKICLNQQEALEESRTAQHQFLQTITELHNDYNQVNTCDGVAEW